MKQVQKGLLDQILQQSRNVHSLEVLVQDIGAVTYAVATELQPRYKCDCGIKICEPS